MKKISSIVCCTCLLTLNHLLFSQENTFPASGNVGIGTTSPYATLEVKGTIRTSNSSERYLNLFTSEDGNAYFNYQGGNSTSRFGFQIDGASRMSITSDGRVGIGITSPKTSALVMQLHGTSPAGNAFNNQLLISGNETTGNANTGGGIGFFGHDGNAERTWGWIRNLKENATSGNYASYLAFATQPNGGSPTEVLRISSAGNIGIGTTIPGTRLQVDRTSPATSFEATIFLKGTETTGAAHTGGALAFYGNDGANDRGWAYIRGLKENGIAGNRASYLSMGTRPGDGATIIERIRISSTGDVGIGTTTPDSKLTVKGIIHAEEVKVDINVPGPDYVFEESYRLLSLEETQVYIKENKHLPGIPSSAEMQQNGVNLLEMNMKLLEKVEELTLHQINLLERLEEQDKVIKKMRREIQGLSGKDN